MELHPWTTKVNSEGKKQNHMTRLVIKSIKLKHKEVYFYSPEALSLGGYNASLEVLANLKLHNTHKHNNINTERD